MLHGNTFYGVIHVNMDSKYYFEVLSVGLVPVADSLMDFIAG